MYSCVFFVCVCVCVYELLMLGCGRVQEEDPKLTGWKEFFVTLVRRSVSPQTEPLIFRNTELQMPILTELIHP